MSEIELIAEQIESMRTVFPLYFGILFIGVVCTVLSFMFEWQMKLGILVGLSMIIVSSVLLITLNSDLKPLRDEIGYLIDAEISSMSCDELRWNIINIIEGSEFTPERLGQNIEQKEDLYYYKCELPLRDEVLKLQ